MKKTLLTLATLLTLNINLYAQEISITDTDGKSYKIEANNDDIKIEGMEGKVVFIFLL